jgi:hypothetical protein
MWPFKKRDTKKCLGDYPLPIPKQLSNRASRVEIITAVNAISQWIDVVFNFTGTPGGTWQVPLYEEEAVK